MSKVRTPDPELFSECWTIWQPVCRDSDGKPKAREAFRKHILDGANAQDIVDAARWHVRDLSAKGRLPYIQLASSWLNAERYEFECIKEREYQARLSEHQQRATTNVTPIRPAGQTAFLRQFEQQKQGQG